MTDGMDGMTDWLFNLTKFGEKNGLENIRELLNRLGNPHRKFKSVHVAGSDGKGSTCAFIASILRKAGLRTGLYTSPHIVRVNERVSVDGSEITDEEFLNLAHRVKDVISEMRGDGYACTFFEAMTAIGFLYFAEKKVDYAVVEVGMGGRFDATNVVVPEVSVICNISLEHTNYLGNTIEEIAFEKAGIIKEGVPVVTCNSGAAYEVISDIAKSKGSYLAHTDSAETSVSEDGSYEVGYLGKKCRLGIPGTFQGTNSMMAAKAVSMISQKITEQNIIDGLSEAKWPGRMQKIDGLPLVVDVTHTAAGMLALSKDVISQYGKVVTVFGVLDDKDVKHIAESVVKMSDAVIVTSPPSERALPAETTFGCVSELTNNAILVPNFEDAAEKAKSVANGRTILVTGSFAMAEAAFALLERSRTRNNRG